MILPDINVLVYAFRQDAERHEEYQQWLETALTQEPVVGIPDMVLSSLVRIVTHPRIFVKPSAIEHAFDFCEYIWAQPNVIRLVPGDRHWSIFKNLCCTVGAKGNLISDAFLAALAIENSAEWVTTDRDFARFPGLRWKHPLY